MPLKMYEETDSSPKKIIGIAAGKGGVGKSTVTVNLALALQHSGFSVGIMDSDLYGPSIRKMLPEDRLPRQQGSRIIPALASGLRLISMGYFHPDEHSASVRAPIANGIVTQFIKNVDWGDLDYLLVDFPPGTGDVQLTLGQQASLTAALIVTTPQEVAIQDVKKAIHCFEQVKVPVLGIVENMSYYNVGGQKHYPFGQGGGKRLAQSKGVPFLGEIPLDPELCQLADRGRSPVTEDHDSVSRQAFLLLAEHVVKHVMNVHSDVAKKISQISPHELEIEWRDKEVTRYRFSDLQKQCPCAGCAEGRPVVDEAVTATRVKVVGRYAIRIAFTSGCSTGIYDFDMLREMGCRV